MTKQILRRASIAALAFGVAAIASGQTDEIVRTIPMAPGGQLTIENIRGEITVAGTDGPELTLRITKRLVDPSAASGAAARAALGRVEIDIRERGDRITVETEYLQRSLGGRFAELFWGGGDVAVDYDVTVPRGAGVAIESILGGVTVEGVDGETRIETVSGDVRLAALARLIEVEMVSGDLRMTDVGSDDELSAEAVSGQITIDGARTPRLDVSTVSGTLALTRVEARRVGVETVSGPVTFYGALAANGRYEFQSHSGSIRVTVPDGTGFDLEAQSYSGSFETNVPITIGRGSRTVELTQPEIDWGMNRNGQREIEGTVGGGGGRLGMSTFSGGMTIVVGGDR